MKPSSHENNTDSTLGTDLTHYEILLLDVDATPPEVQSSYDRLRQLWHDEFQKGDHQATARLDRIESAYGVLKDSRLRQQYDALLFRSPDLHNNDNEVAKKGRYLPKYLFLKTRILWVALGFALLLAAGGMLLQNLLSRGHVEHEVELLRRYYPPAPKMLHGPEQEKPSPLFDLDKLKTPHRESLHPPDGGAPLLRSEGFVEAEPPLLMATPAPSSGLLRSTPIHELPPSALIMESAIEKPLAVYDETALVFHENSDELLHERVAAFVRSYLDSFERKDFDALGEHLDVNALEDGKSWSKVLQEYRDKFESVETIRHEMIVGYIAKEPNGLVTVKGEYHLRYDYKDGVRDSSTGTFQWSLRDTGTQLTLLNAQRGKKSSGRIR